MSAWFRVDQAIVDLLKMRVDEWRKKYKSYAENTNTYRFNLEPARHDLDDQREEVSTEKKDGKHSLKR